jgi:hypothetical protein
MKIKQKLILILALFAASLVLLHLASRTEAQQINATYFNGNRYIIINDSFSNFTFVGWVEYTKFNGIGVIASQGIGEGVHSTWYVGAGGEVENVTACGVFSDQKVGNYTAGWRFAIAPFIGIDKWTQVACTYNGSYISIYINGKLVNKTSTPYKVFGQKIIEIGKRTSDFYINNQPTQAYFNGYLKDIQFYNFALNESEIRNLYQMGMDAKPLANFSIYMPMDGNFTCFEGNGYCKEEVVN